MALLILCQFAFLYNVSFLAAPALTTGRITLLLLLALYHAAWPDAWRRIFGSSQVLIACLALLTAYALAQYALESRGDVTQLSRLINFTIYVVIGTPLFALASGYDLRRFLTAFAAAAGIQALFIAVSFVSPAYRAGLAGLVVQGGNIPLTYGLQVPGFSNSAGALLSMTQALGAFAALLAARLSPSRQERRTFILLAVECALSTIVVGRTGLQLSVIIFTAFIVIGGPAVLGRSLVIAGALALLVALSADWLVDQAVAWNPSAAATLEWAFEFFVTGARGTFFRDFAGQGVPPLGIESLVGTGRVVAMDGMSNASGSDSGYIQTYYALGFPAALIFYGAFYAYLLSAFARVRTERAALAVLVACTLVLEVKEPFIFKYALPFFLLVLLALAGRDAGSNPLTAPGR
jgi:hypothetical protein